MALNPIIDARDVRFILFEMLKVDHFSRFPEFADFDKDTYEEVITLAEKIAVGKIYPINQESDKIHAQYNPANNEVKIPEGIKAGLSAYYEAGFLGLPASQELGGTGMPLTVFYACMDFFTSASVALAMYPVLSMGALNMYITFMKEDTRRTTIIDKMLTGEWGGTMCLTEPDAGSDVGALKTKAVKNSDGTYSITGQKIFISSGDNDFYKNMVHPVLARIEGDPAGTKGISIFMVPKYWINEDGSVGGFNDVVCSGIEHKMGITASATCTMNFGDEGKCRGILIGEERQGMKIMFQMMNEARLFVGSQGCSVSSAAYMHAVTYARNRIQGVDVTQMQNPDAKGVAIINHPDVKRMLLLMKSKVEAMRTLDYYVAQCYTLAEVAVGEEREEAEALVDFLIPITKAGNTDTAWEVTSEAIQTYGGYGFCSDYPVEQYARDAKILAIYEGTNGIQSMDLTMRKILMNKDQYNFKIFKKRIAETIESARGIVDDKYITTFEKAVIKIDQVIDYLKEEMSKGKILGIFANATPLQQTLTRLTHAWMHLWALTIVKTKMKELVGDRKGSDLDRLLKEDSEAAYYTGRVLSGEFYLGAEFQKFFGSADYILSGESAVIKATSAVFSGALEE